MDELAPPPAGAPPGDAPEAGRMVALRDVNERLLISALREQELAAELEAERTQLAVILAAIADAVLVVDAQGRPVLTNPAYARMMMGDPEGTLVLEDAGGQPLALEETPWRRAARGEAFSQEYCAVAADGTRRWWEAHGRPIGKPTRALGGVLVIRDISAHKELQAALLHQALHDPLTGLPNRALIYDRLDQALRLAQRNGEPLAFLLLDLDQFKKINDTIGHQAGDLLLCEIAARLRLMLRVSDTVGRLGGDEFIMLLPGTDRDGAVGVAKTILTNLAADVIVAGQTVQVTVSIGIAVSSGWDTDAETLLRQADLAMYEAKRAGSGHAVYAAVDAAPGL